MFKLPFGIPMWAKLLLLAALLAGATATGYHFGFQSSEVHAQKDTIAQLNKQKADNAKLQADLEKKREEQQKTSAKLQDALAKLKPQAPEVKYVYRTITKEVEKPVYKQCVIPASGMSSLNANAAELNQLRKLAPKD